MTLIDLDDQPAENQGGFTPGHCAFCYVETTGEMCSSCGMMYRKIRSQIQLSHGLRERNIIDRELPSELQPSVSVDEKAIKAKENKPRLDLIPVGPLWELGRAFAYGTLKYRDNLWRDEPTSVQARLNSALHHIYQTLDGENMDEESGLWHLSLALAQVCMAFGYLLDPERFSSQDDRWDPQIVEKYLKELKVE